MQNVTLGETSRAKAFRTVEERIVKKSLDLIVLKAVKNEPLSGYAIILLIQKKYGVRLSAGTVYSLLFSLEKKGYIKGSNQNTRNYSLTKKGENTLEIVVIMQNRIRVLNNKIF